MHNPKINLLKEISIDDSSLSPLHHRKSRWRRRLLLGALFLFVALVILFIVNIVIPGIRLSASLGSSNFLTQLQHLAFSRDRDIAGENEDRINILLMGIGGAGHDGPLLTDTIIIASVQPSTGKASLISLPRDLYIPYPNGSWRKINEAYSLGEGLYPGDGGSFAAETIGSVVGLNLSYYTVVDFNGFEKIIDKIGRVHINVERSFTDHTYPTSDDKVQTVSFEAGWQWMDGATALRYARSRHGNNGEGSDFARARRQQKILLATKERILSTNVLLNPLTINNLAGQLAGNIETNIEPWELWRLYTIGKNIGGEHVIRLTPDNAPGGLLVSETSLGGAFILQPRSGNFGDIQLAAKNIFSTNGLVQEPPRVSIQNGTNVSGLAANLSTELQRRGYRVVGVTNAEDRTVTQTIIYDYTGGGKQTSLAALRVYLEARVVTSIPDWLVPSATTLDPNADAYRAPVSGNRADFLIIIGSDSVPLLGS